HSVLANGAQLLLMERHDVPLISMTLTLAGGPLADEPGREGSAALLADLMEKGAGARNAAEWAEAVAAAGGEIDIGATRESLQLSAEFLARDSALMLELASDALLRPRLDAGEFDKLRQRTIDELAADKDGDPGALLGFYGYAWLLGNSGYGRSYIGDETTLKQITLADLQRYYRQQLGGDRLIIAIAGDFNAAALAPQVERAFGGWRKAELPLQAPVAAQRQHGRRVLLVDKPGATQSYFWIGNVGTTHNDPARVPQELVNEIFGGRYTSMLNSELRIKSGLSYSAGSRIARLRQPGPLYVQSFTATETTRRAIDLALQTLARLHREGVSPAALKSTQDYVIGSFPPEFETASQLSAHLAELAFHGLGRDEVDDYAARVRAVTSAQARQVVDQLYPPAEDVAMVVIGDAAKIRGELASYGAVTEMKMSAPRFAP
ncbi:MAG TPA: pitrilysin family protein, partial [Nevskiaceae bacterium]|nr:pitrilysin family protein [Nevskiaceae bacterium]